MLGVFKIEQLVTDKQLNKAFQGTNFGKRTPRELIRNGILKHTCGYYTGHTIECVLKEIGLLTEKGKPTKIGKEYLYLAFEDGTSV